MKKYVYLCGFIIKKNHFVKVLHLINHVAHIGGLETYWIRLCSELASRDIQQAVLFNKRDESVQLPVFWVPKDGRSEIFIRDFSPDIIHVHNIFDHHLLDRLVSRYRVVFTSHGFQLICPAQDFYQEWPRTECQLSGGLHCLAVTLFRKCVSPRPSSIRTMFAFTRWALSRRKDIAHVICPCSHAAERHLRAGFPEHSLTTLPYFCDLQVLAEPRPWPKRRTVTFLGRIAPYKGVDYFIRILAGLADDVRGLIVGNPDEKARAEILELARVLGVEARLEIRDWAPRSEIGEVFAETSAFIFPSLWPETLGIVGLEAMAHGVPVIAFKVGGVMDWLDDGQTGYSVPVKDVAGASAACLKILDDEDLAARMGRNALERVREIYSVERHMDGLLDVYENVCR